MRSVRQRHTGAIDGSDSRTADAGHAGPAQGLADRRQGGRAHGAPDLLRLVDQEGADRPRRPDPVAGSGEPDGQLAGELQSHQTAADDDGGPAAGLFRTARVAEAIEMRR